MAINNKKLADMMMFIANHPAVQDLGVTKLYKLVYFADVAHLRAYGHTISGSEYIRYPHGPVPSRADRVLKQLCQSHALKETRKILAQNMEQRCISIITEHPLTTLIDDERTTLHSTCERHGKSPAKFLSELSHQEPAWLCAKPMDKLSATMMHYGPEEDPDGL